MYQMTKLPDAKIKEILDEPQWRLLSKQFNQARGMGPWLTSNGLIAQGTDAPPIAVPAQGIEAQRSRRHAAHAAGARGRAQKLMWERE